MPSAAHLVARRSVAPHDNLIAAAALVLATAAGAAAALLGALTLAAVAAICFVGLVALAPQLGAYAYLLLSPLIVGIARGGPIAPLRPNEALLLLLLVALAVRLAIRGFRELPQWTRVDVAVLLLVVTGSCMPVLMRVARDLPLSDDDLLYALVLPKYAAVLLFFRIAVRTTDQVQVCLRSALLSAAVVAIIGVLQVRSLFGVPELLATYYDQPFSGTWQPVVSRATSTVASSFGVAVIMALSLAIVMASLVQSPWRRAWLLLASAIYLGGSFAAGQFTGVIALVIALLAVGLVTRTLHRIALLVLPLGVVVLIIVWPVIEQRLAGFVGVPPLPPSWLGRMDNLQRFILPELLTVSNVIWGVRPAARVVAPEAWREFVFIESGYIWLLWTGGVFLLLAFGYFASVSLPALAAQARRRDDAVGVAAAAAFAAVAMVVVLMVFDPHLTMRGGADLLYPLLALALVRGRPESGDGATPAAPCRRRAVAAASDVGVAAGAVSLGRQGSAQESQRSAGGVPPAKQPFHSDAWGRPPV